jgi:hypothetical protein
MTEPKVPESERPIELFSLLRSNLRFILLVTAIVTAASSLQIRRQLTC